MKKSRTRSARTELKAQPACRQGRRAKRKSKIKVALVAIGIIFLASFLIFLRLSSTNKLENGEVKFTGTLLTEPKVYDRWQYFDINGYRVKASSELEISYGDRLEVVGLAEEGKINNPEINLVGSSGQQKVIYNLRQKLKEKITAALPEPQASLLAGVVLGAKEELPADFKDSLRKTGTIHVVVVSGYNISVIAGFLIGLSRFIKRQYAIFIGLVGIAFYTLLVGADAPAVRAAIMGSLALTATFLGRQRFAFYTLILTAVLMLIVKPTVIQDIGFQLSFLATAGIILFQEKIFAFFKWVPKAASEDLATTLAAQALVVPVIFYHFGNVSAISPLANAAVLWTIPLVTIFGFVFLAASFVVPFLAVPIALILWAFLSIFVFLIEQFSKLSFTYLNFSAGNFWPVLVYYAVFVIFILYLKYVRVAKSEQN